MDEKLKEKYEQIVGKPLEIPKSQQVPAPQENAPQPQPQEEAQPQVAPLPSSENLPPLDPFEQQRYQRIAVVVIVVGIILFVVFVVIVMRNFQFGFSLTPETPSQPLMINP